MKEFIIRVIDPEEIQWYEEEPETPELVRCKDCMFGRPYENIGIGCNAGIGCEREPVHSFDWFCADGIRKKE